MFDIGIIGAGPGGYSAAIRASQLGLKVVLFEKDEIGGTCLNKGCIPTKTIIHSASLFSSIKTMEKFGVFVENPTFDYSKIAERKDDVVSKIRKSLTSLIESYGITIIRGEAKIVSTGKIEANDEIFDCKNIIIATGSIPNKLNFDWAESKNVLDSNDILELKEIPENIVIVGSGAIGIEWARIFSSLGKKITVVEIAKNIVPIADTEVSSRIERLLKKNRVQLFVDSSIKDFSNGKVTLSNEKVIDADIILLAAGRSALFPQESEKIEKTRFITVDENFETSSKGIFAIGDVNGVSMLAHSAIHQGLAVVDYIANKKSHSFDRLQVPSVIYGNPEIAWIGETEQSLVEQNINFKKSFFPIAALGKAQADNEIDGFVKILANDTKILGAHVVAPEASSIIEQFAIAMKNSIKPEDIADVIFAHPTYSEGVHEAILGLSGLSVHLPPQNN